MGGTSDAPLRVVVTVCNTQVSVNETLEPTQMVWSVLAVTIGIGFTVMVAALEYPCPTGKTVEPQGVPCTIALNFVVCVRLE